MVVEYNIIILKDGFSANDLPDWMQKFDSGCNLTNGRIDVWISNKDYAKAKKYFLAKNIKTRIIKYDDEEEV